MISLEDYRGEDQVRWTCRWTQRCGRAGLSALASASLAAMFGLSAVPTASAAPAHRSGAPAASDIVTMAEAPGAAPNYIMPFMGSSHSVLQNTNLSYQMWPTLYTIGNARNVNTIDTALSLAKPPVFSDGDTQVTVTLKPWKWSDGKPITVRDVTFFMNLVKFDKLDWFDYTPGNMPTNLLSVSALGTNKVVFRLERAYNPTWFTDTELAFVVPMPQQVWDRESATGPVGTYDTTAAGAKAVYTFLNKQGEDTATYDTNLGFPA